MTYRTNLFNNNYIILTPTTIIKKHQEYLNNNTDNNAFFWHSLYHTLKIAYTNANDSIAFEKNTLAAKIIMSELSEEERNITAEDIKNACIIAAYNGHNNIAGHLAQIIINNPKTNNFGTEDEFTERFCTQFTNYIVNNNSLKEYQNQKSGKYSYEYDKYVYLYEDNKLVKTELPLPEKSKIKTKTK